MNKKKALETLRLHKMRDELFLATARQDGIDNKTIQDRAEHMKLCYDMIESLLSKHD
jgi:hypothetical protein